MRANLTHCFTFVFISLVFFSCKKQTEVIDDYDYQTERLTEIMPLEVGKFIIYQTDSLVFTNFNRVEETHYYIEKDTIDGKFTDAMGRTSYRITRYLKDLSGTKPWFTSGTFFVTPTEKNVELIEDNLRFVRLALPLREGTTWKGNLYLSAEPYQKLYEFNNDNGMENWDYRFTKTNDVFNYNSTQLNNIVTVTGINISSLPDTVTVAGTSVNLSGKTSVYLRGTTTDTIILSAAPPAPNTSPFLTVYNRSDQPAKLDNISIPAGMGRKYEFAGGKWTFGDKENGTRIDVLTSELPYGSKYLLVDKYAKGVGLVYQEYVLWEYEYKFTTTGADDGVKKGFGVKRRMINHN